jgi:hypothetical protein
VEGIVITAAMKAGILPSAGIEKKADLANCRPFTNKRAFLTSLFTPIVTGSPGRGFSGITVYLI